MKFFKKLTLFLLIFFITALMFLIQFTITFNSIVFSKDYIEESFDENNVGFLMTNEILNNNELLSYVTKDTDKQKTLLKSMNKEWIDEQNPILIKGTYRYLIGEDDKLPTINIEPIKNNIVSIAVEEALKEYNVLLIPYIKEKVKSAYGLNIVEFDLYEIIIETLSNFGYLERCFKMEEGKGREHVLLKAIKTSLRITEDDDLFLEYISSRLEDADIVFLSGVGKAWPIIRSHTILNNLHRIVEKQPLVMFFPGTYDGGTLMLFNKLKDDNYYRAFNLVDKY